MNQALSVARQLNGEQRQFVTFSLSHRLSCWRLDGWLKRGDRKGSASREGKAGTKACRAPVSDLELGLQILLHRTPQNWLSEGREVVNMQPDKLFFRAGGRREKEMICPQPLMEASGRTDTS